MDERSQGQMEIFFLFEVAPQRRARLPTVNLLKKRGTAKSQQRIAFINKVTQKDNGIAFVFEPLRCDVLGFFNQTDHSDRWSGINRTVRTLIVKADVASRNRCVE